MADWTLPRLSDLKVDVLEMLKLRDVDSIVLAENVVNPPTGAKRWNTAQSKFQAWNGVAWVDLVLSIAGGGTGSTNPGDFLTNFGLGTMSTQNSNNVNITGGSITGLTNLSALGNFTVAGVIVAGSIPTVITNSAGQILESAIADGNLYARIAAGEIITGNWTFNASPTISHIAPQLRFFQTDGAANEKYTTIIADANQLDIRFYNDATDAYGSPLIFKRSGITPALVDASGDWRFNSPVTIGAATNVTAELKLNGLTGAVVKFHYNGVPNGQITSSANVLYIDQNTVNFRTTNGATLLAQLDSLGALYVVGSIRSGAGTISYPDTNNAISMGGSTINLFTDELNIINKANTYYIARITPTLFSIPRADSVLCVSGPVGEGMRVYKSGINAFYTCHQGAGVTYWYDAPGNNPLLSINTADGLHSYAGFRAPNGAPDKAAVRFNNVPNSGMYLASGTNITAEFGAQFDLSGHRSVMRAFHNIGGKIDFLIASKISMTVHPGAVWIGDGANTFTSLVCFGHCNPFASATYNCGLSSAPWAYIFSNNVLQVSSDIRQKDVHGPITGVLDVIDSVDTFIASFKKETRPKENTDPNYGKKFPSFSAQQIQEKIDSKFGTRIVNDENPDMLFVGQELMIPLLWQAVKELSAKVRALAEP